MSARSVVASLVVVAVVAGIVAAGWDFLRESSAPVSTDATAKTLPPATEAPTPAPAVAPSLEPTRTPTKEAPSAKRGLFGALFGGGDKKPQPADDEPAKIAIDGVVIVTDAQGVEHREESGTLMPAFYDAADPAEVAKPGRRIGRSWRTGEAVNVTAGRFHVEVPPDRRFGTEALMLGGRATLAEGEPLEVVTGQAVTLRARWIDGIRLHAVDATTHVELDDVEVVRSHERFVWGRSHPGDAADYATVVDHAASPLTVMPGTDDFHVRMQDFVFVRAAAHAWARVELDFEKETEKTVELGPGATLIVDVQGELPRRAPPAPSLEELAARVFGGGPSHRRDAQEDAPRLCLRVPAENPSFDEQLKEALDHFDEASPSEFPGGKKPTLEEFKRMIETMRGVYEASQNVGEKVVTQAAVLGETRMESLKPGDFVVSVEIGDESDTPLVAGKAPAKLVDGQTTRVALVLKPVAVAEPVPLAGTLFVPAGWKTHDLLLQITPIDLPGKSRSDERRIRLREMVALPGRPGWFHWSAGDVLPATYNLEVDGSGYARAVKIGPSGDDHVELKLGEPATLIVHVVDEASGQPVELEWLHFRTSGEELLFGSMSQITLEHDADHARYVATVPIGPGALESFGDNEWTLDEAGTSVDVHAGEQEVTLRVHRSCGVLIALTCGGAKVAWPEDLGWECTLAPVGDAGSSTWTSTRNDLPCLAVSIAGRYRVKLPEIPGYAPVEPFEVDVPAGEFVTKTVELTRK